MEREVIAKEKLTAEEEFLKENKTADQLSVKTTLEDVRHSLIHLPVITGRYRVQGEIFSFVINGQTGEIDGQYPLLNGATPLPLISQDSLAKEDKENCYVPGMSYLLLPKSPKVRGSK